MDEKKDLHIGLKAELEEIVSKKNIASTLASGGLDVYATPAMITLMERASFTAVRDYLPEGCSTVGTLVNIKHNSASPLGAKIIAQALLKEIDGRRLVFSVRAFNGDDLIGEGLHERFIINNEKFMAKIGLNKNPAE
ncbi:MAG: thioesterase family protein [Spirochaetaceae bacterium]|jgi:predicted thioesterase|nr:thioesterase family protein [Spirochaetaceae bacterium]